MSVLVTSNENHWHSGVHGRNIESCVAGHMLLYILQTLVHAICVWCFNPNFCWSNSPFWSLAQIRQLRSSSSSTAEDSTACLALHQYSFLEYVAIQPSVQHPMIYMAIWSMYVHVRLFSFLTGWVAAWRPCRTSSLCTTGSLQEQPGMAGSPGPKRQNWCHVVLLPRNKWLASASAAAIKSPARAEESVHLKTMSYPIVNPSFVYKHKPLDFWGMIWPHYWVAHTPALVVALTVSIFELPQKATLADKDPKHLKFTSTPMFNHTQESQESCWDNLYVASLVAARNRRTPLVGFRQEPRLQSASQ